MCNDRLAYTNAALHPPTWMIPLCLCDCVIGMFADAVAVLEVEGKNVVKRFAPQRLEVWKNKRDEYLRVFQEGKDRRRKEWVSGV